MQYKVVKVVGLNTDLKAAQAYSLSQDSEHLFLAVLVLNCDDAFTKGRQLLSELSDAFFDPSSANLDEKLPEGEKLSKVFNLAKDKLGEGEEMDLVVGAVSGKVLYLFAQGEVDVLLKRGDNLSSLVDINNSSGLVSGFLQEEDRVLFATKSLTHFLGENLQKNIEMDLSVWEEDISSRLAVEGTDDDGLAGLILSVESESDISIPKSTQEVEDKEEKLSNTGKNPLASLFSRLFTKKEEQTAFSVPKSLAVFRLIPSTAKGRLFLGLLLLIIISLGIGYKFKQARDQEINNNFNQVLSQARDDLSLAQSLQSLNPSEAKAKLDKAKEEVNKALSIKPGDPQAIDLKNSIEQNTDSILQQNKASFDLFLDMDLVKSGFKADKFTVSGNNLLLLDTSNKTLVTVDISKKSNQILAGSDQLGESLLASINGGFSFVFSKDKGLLRIDNSNKKVTNIAKSDKDLVSVVDITGFGSNVYLLDSGVNKIWKYVPTSSGYSGKQEYLTKGSKADFSNALRMQIESSIYVLKQGGEILRFTKGSSDNFSLGGLDKGVKDPKSIFTSSDTENLYILDSGNERVVVVTKTGSYKAQYQGDKFALASDFIVDEKGKKIYLLEGGKVYTTELK